MKTKRGFSKRRKEELEEDEEEREEDEEEAEDERDQKGCQVSVAPGSHAWNVTEIDGPRSRVMRKVEPLYF